MGNLTTYLVSASLILLVIRQIREHPLDAALEEQRNEKYRHALIAVVSIGVRAGQLGAIAAWLSSRLVSSVGVSRP